MVEGIFQVYGQSSWAWLEPPWAGRAAGTTAGAAAAALRDVSASFLLNILRDNEIKR